jgi:hypothetical protein
MKYDADPMSLLSKERNYTFGIRDGQSDLINGRRDRRNIPSGVLFSLPLHNPAYCEGYRNAQENGLAAAVEASK